MEGPSLGTARSDAAAVREHGCSRTVAACHAAVGARCTMEPMSLDLDQLRRLRRARDQMDREYAEPLDVPALARTALMSAAHFSRRFREEYGETPYSYLLTRRIERAKALLRRGDLSVTDVCFAVGWTSLGSFSSRFTEVVGALPSVYRAQCHDELRAVPPCRRARRWC